MAKAGVIFWNVDTQVDFVEPSGKLSVPGAALLKPVLKELTLLAERNNITVVNTADYHFAGSAELSGTPDFIRTFPPHCMAGTSGAGYIDETIPENALVFEWDRDYDLNEFSQEANFHRNIVIRKDAFDVFAGNPNSEKILKLLDPESVIVYGVTTNVCVNDAVIGLAKRGLNVFVVEDAIKELPNIPLPFNQWSEWGVKLIQSAGVEKLIKEITS